MSYYAVLAIATLLWFLLGAAIWFRTKSIAFVLGLGFIYYWTLWGGWFLIYDLRGGESGMQYSYFFYKLFPVHLDADYFTTLLLFSLFVVTCEITVLFCAKRESAQLPARPIRIFHNKMLIIAAISGAVSFLIIRNSLGAASGLGVAAYQYVRNDPSISRFFTLHQVLNRICLFTTLMGLAICVSGRDAKYVAGRATPGHKALYVLLLAGVFLLNLTTGNRHDLILTLMIGAMFYLVNARKPKKLMLVLGCVTILLGVGIIGLTRGVSVKDTLLETGFSGAAVSSFTTYAKSNEPFAAHISLYGVLHKQIELTYGSSLVVFLTSVIPRAIWVNRPDDIYVYYAARVGAVEGQGYTIHHATGWYLNFGTFGIVLGAVLCGWIWANRWTRFQRADGTRGYWQQVFDVIAFWMFTGSISLLVRTGPEGYKTVLLEGFLIPTLILGFAGSTFVLRSNRPRLVFGERHVSERQSGSEIAC